MNLRLALSTIIIPATIAISAATDTLTIATYNIRNCIGMDMTQDIDRTAKAIQTFGSRHHRRPRGGQLHP